MKIIDVENPKKLKKTPDKSVSLISSGNFKEKGFVIKNIELREYVEKNDEKLGPFSLITSFVETDKGSIEMTYYEGYRSKETLEMTKDFILNNLGLAGLILRSVISLKAHLEKENA